MANETVRPKRSPVKPDVMNTAVQGAQRPTDRPDLKFIESILGSLDTEQRAVYDNGYWDDDPKRGVLTADDVRIYEKARVDAHRQVEAMIRLRKVRAEQIRAREAARLAAQDPAEYTCIDCGEQYEHLRNAKAKVCVECAEKRIAADIARIQKQEAERLTAERQAAKQPEKVWTPEESDVERRKWRLELEKATRRVKRIPTITATLNYIQRRRNAIEWWNDTPAAREERALLDRHAHYLRGLRERFEARLTYSEDGYHTWMRAERQDRERAGQFPTFAYCRYDGLSIPWAQGFCDDVCATKFHQHGAVKIDMGAECGACHARLAHGTPEQIAALPRVDDQIMHTFACLMSQPIDPDDYKDFSPEAACWQPILHNPLVRPAWSYKDRAMLSLPVIETIKALASGEQPMPAALPIGRTRFMLPGSQEQEDDRRMLAWAAQFKGSYFTLAQARTGTGKGWIATARVKPSIERLVAEDKLTEHPGIKNRWRIAEQNENH
jgi:DNA-directed RNA polymerase subunit RPC12/RpoP